LQQKQQQQQHQNQQKLQQNVQDKYCYTHKQTTPTKIMNIDNSKTSTK
jgi:hypothetical protein